MTAQSDIALPLNFIVGDFGERCYGIMDTIAGQFLVYNFNAKMNLVTISQKENHQIITSIS